MMSGQKLFRVFKYLLFSLLMFNLFYYLVEDLNAYRYLGANPSLGQILETFAVTIDFAAWMVLVVLFELETDPVVCGHRHARRDFSFAWRISVRVRERPIVYPACCKA